MSVATLHEEKETMCESNCVYVRVCVCVCVREREREREREIVGQFQLTSD